MLQTTHYNLTKPELQDSPPDITVMNPNWDLIDTYLHEAYVNKLTAVDEIPAAPLPRDADRLGGFAASYFADKASAQMFKLTADDGLPKSIIANTNGAISPGVYRVEPSTLNRPDNVSYGALRVTARTSGDIFQEVYSIQGDHFSRVSLNAGSSWTAWVKKADANNAIVETGSNANGNYVKFGDGTMICRHTSWRTANSSGNIDASLSFASLFASPPTVIGQMQDTGSQVWSGNLYLGDVVGNSVRIVVIGGGSGVSYYINYIAIGKWK